MASPFTKFLTGVAQGITNPKGQLGDWRHAERLYLDGNYRLAPRTKFSYHVVFEIDPMAMQSPTFKGKHIGETEMLIKTADLPKFTIETITKNQYNRKKVVQKSISYEPITLTLHDDSEGVTNAMWALYYGYYYRDRNVPLNAYSPNPYLGNMYRNGFDNDVSVPFFKSISIYTMSQRRFLGYTLVNPMITAWQHGQVSQSDSQTPMENTMTIAYESVIYSGGAVKKGTPKGFATLHYDNLPSPLSMAGGGTATLTGQGGVLSGLESVFGSVADGTAFNSPLGFLSTAVTAVNTMTNLRNLTSAGLKNEAINILTSPVGIAGAVGIVGGLVGSVFPKSQNTNDNQDTTTATAKAVTEPSTPGYTMVPSIGPNGDIIQRVIPDGVTNIGWYG
jgi:hypothetical protein